MTEITVTEGSGNVFADLEVSNAEEELPKAQLTYRIRAAIEQQGLPRAEAAKLLGVRQPQAAMLMRNRSGNFSIGRLMGSLAKLGQDVQITVRPRSPERTSGRVQLLAPPAAAAPIPEAPRARNGMPLELLREPTYVRCLRTSAGRLSRYPPPRNSARAR
jgi:predicted XRE-type DNA-binding protein